MSTLDGVCASADALAEMVLRYEPLRIESPLAAARLRKQMTAAAVALKANVAVARSKRDDALKAWTPSGAIPLRIRPDNDVTSSMPDSIA